MVVVVAVAAVVAIVGARVGVEANVVVRQEGGGCGVVVYDISHKPLLMAFGNRVLPQPKEARLKW